MAQWWGACLASQKVESIRELRIPNYISIQSLYHLQNSQESQVVQQMVATLFKVTFYYHAVTTRDYPTSPRDQAIFLRMKR